MTVSEFLDKKTNRIGLAIVILGVMVYVWANYNQAYPSSESNTQPPSTNK